MKEATRSRRSSPLSHSGSVNQHLGRQTGERFMASERCQVTGSSAQRATRATRRRGGPGLELNREYFTVPFT